MTPTQTIESVYDAFNRGDIPYILSQCAPNVTWRQSSMLPWGGDRSGISGVTEFFTKLGAAMQTTSFVARENVEVGEEVFSFGEDHGSSVATGKRAGLAPWMFRWKVSGGKIVAWDSYIDTAAILTALT